MRPCQRLAHAMQCGQGVRHPLLSTAISLQSVQNRPARLILQKTITIHLAWQQRKFFWVHPTSHSAHKYCACAYFARSIIKPNVASAYLNATILCLMPSRSSFYKLGVPHCRPSHFYRSISPPTSPDWKHLPAPIVSIPESAEFKDAISDFPINYVAFFAFI